MYANLYKNPSENNSILQLIAKLLETIHRSDVRKSLEATKCLGELGPHDLSTIALASDDGQQNNYAFVSPLIIVKI